MDVRSIHGYSDKGWLESVASVDDPRMSAVSRESTDGGVVRQCGITVSTESMTKGG